MASSSPHAATMSSRCMVEVQDSTLFRKGRALGRHETLFNDPAEIRGYLCRTLVTSVMTTTTFLEFKAKNVEGVGVVIEACG